MSRLTATADRLDAAVRQRRRASLDRRIPSQPLRLPDLTSPGVRAAAAEVGVDLSGRVRIDAADRAHDARR